MNSLFRIDGPTEANVKSFHEDGYIFFPDILKDGSRKALINEIENSKEVQAYLNSANYADTTEPQPYFVRPWNERGIVGHALIDDPFITRLLQKTIGDHYHFCHSALNIAPRGVGPGKYHQDNHHWNHEYPINHHEREKYYIQILYYPNGFKKGDRNLKVIPGSHHVKPTDEEIVEKMLAGTYDKIVGRTLKEVRLSAPPGSMVYLNARMFHAIESKPFESPQAHRIFNIDIFKEVGPPHRYTQKIPSAWLENATPYRMQLFSRLPYTDDCWKP